VIASLRKQNRIERIPPHIFFLIGAVFHYLGPAFAVLLFAHVDVLGVAWLRIVSAGMIFGIWRRPWRILAAQSRRQRGILCALGVVLAAMNVTFYEAVARLPLGTVGAIEFIGPILLAALGTRTSQNTVALLLAASGGWVLTDLRWGGEPLGYLFAFANCLLFMFYIVLGHRIAQGGGMAGIDRLGAAMLIAVVAISPIGFTQALPTFQHLDWLLAGIGVGVCSSVIPYITDQLAMARLSRATFALLLSLLPASAMAIGVLLLRQIPTVLEVIGILLVVAGVALRTEHESVGE